MGQCPNNNRYTPYVYTGGTAYALNLPAGDGYTGSGAGILALNTSGQAVGFTTPGNPPLSQGAVWTYTISGGVVTAQTATDIKPWILAQFPTMHTSDLLAINSSGIAVGVWSVNGVPSFTGPGSIGGSFTYNVNDSTIIPLDGLLVNTAVVAGT